MTILGIVGLLAFIAAGVAWAAFSRRISAEVRADRAERDRDAADHRAKEAVKAQEVRRETDRGSFDDAVDDL